MILTAIVPVTTTATSRANCLPMTYLPSGPNGSSPFRASIQNRTKTQAPRRVHKELRSQYSTTLANNQPAGVLCTPLTNQGGANHHPAIHDQDSSHRGANLIFGQRPTGPYGHREELSLQAHPASGVPVHQYQWAILCTKRQTLEVDRGQCWSPLRTVKNGALCAPFFCCRPKTGGVAHIAQIGKYGFVQLYKLDVSSKFLTILPKSRFSQLFWPLNNFC